MIKLSTESFIVLIFAFGFLVEICRYIKLFYKINFLQQFQNELSSLHKNFIDNNIDFALTNIQYLAKNLIKYKRLVNRKIKTDKNLDVLELLVFNFFRFYNREYGFYEKDFYQGIFALICNIEVESGAIKEEVNKFYRLFNPLVYLHNTFKVFVDVLLSVIPNFPTNWIRKLITLIAEISGIITYLKTYHYDFLMEFLSKISFLNSAK